MGRWIALIAALVAAFVLARASEQTPAPAAVDAPPGEFSAGRAMDDVRIIAKVPHPVGSPANAAVRDHVLARMRALGLETQVQRAEAFNRRAFGDDVYVGGGIVENVIGVLPGQDRAAPALAIMAHYDSVPGSPGAADDAAGVASALEIARALKTKGQPARDVILLITDGEEAGLLGAEAFFGQHPLAKRIGFLINMEARGNGGRAQMFQTGPDNGGTLELFRKTAVRPTSSSLAVFLYENMPNDTDFTVSRKAGVAGLNYAFIGRQFDYHMPTATPANLDQGSLQDLGGQTLAAAREAAFAPALPAKAPDLTYSNTAGSHILAYHPAVGWAVLALSTVLSAIGAWRTRRKDLLHWRDLLKGAGVSLYLLAAAAAMLRLARRAATEGSPGFLEQHVLLAQVTRWEIALALVAVGALLYAASAVGIGKMRLPAAALALAAGLACSAFGGWDLIGLGLGVGGGVAALVTFGRPGTLSGVWAGLLLTGFLVAVALQIAAPTTAFLVAWPLTAAALAAAISGFGVSRGPAMLTVLAAIAALAGAWILGFAHGVFLGLDMPELMALFVWLAAFLLWPLAQPAEGDRAARLAGLAVLLAGFAGVGLVRLDPPWTERHPQPTGVAYHMDLDTGRAARVSFGPDADPWTRAVLAADGGAVETRSLTGFRRPVSAAAAKAIAAPGPAVTLTRDADGLVVLKAVPPAGARILNLDLKPTAALSQAAINGQSIEALQTAGQWTRIRWVAAPGGLTLTFRAAGPGALEARYAAITEQWPAEAKPLPPRPPEAMAFDVSDSTVVAGARRFTW